MPALSHRRGSPARGIGLASASCTLAAAMGAWGRGAVGGATLAATASIPGVLSGTFISQQPAVAELPPQQAGWSSGPWAIMAAQAGQPPWRNPGTPSTSARRPARKGVIRPVRIM